MYQKSYGSYLFKVKIPSVPKLLGLTWNAAVIVDALAKSCTLYPPREVLASYPGWFRIVSFSDRLYHEDKTLSVLPTCIFAFSSVFFAHAEIWQ